jgi:hypothetical protein
MEFKENSLKPSLQFSEKESVKVYSDYPNIVASRKNGVTDADIFCGTDYKLGFLEDLEVTFKCLGDIENPTCTNLSDGNPEPVIIEEALSSARLLWLSKSLTEYQELDRESFAYSGPPGNYVSIDLNKFTDLLNSWTEHQDLDRLKKEYQDLDKRP